MEDASRNGAFCGDNSELISKYQKLAAEYAKVRAQVAVLKKAVVEEQAKREELRDTLKERDHFLRKKEQEMESLEFRNQQLTRRVVVLQEELDVWQQKQRSKNKKMAVDTLKYHPELANSIISEELQKKIEENVMLHHRLSETEVQYQDTIKELQNQLEKMENEISNHHNIVDEEHKKYQSLIDKLQQDRVSLETKFHSLEKDLKEANVKVTTFKEQLQRTQEDLGSKLEMTTNIIRSHLPFMDTKLLNLNALNMPSYSKHIQERSGNIVTKVGELFKDLIAGFSDFHTYSAKRTLNCSVEGSNSISSINKRLALYLNDNGMWLQQLEHSFCEFEKTLQVGTSRSLEINEAFQNFLIKLQSYILYLKKITPYHLLSLEEESSLPTCSSPLKVKNQSLANNWQQMLVSFDKIETYTRLLNDSSLPSVIHKAFNNIIVGVADLHKTTKDMFTNYNDKVTFTKESSSASETLQTMDEYILTSLVRLEAGFEKLRYLLSEELDSVLEDQNAALTVFPTSKSSPALSAPLSNRPFDYITNQEVSMETTSVTENVTKSQTLQNGLEDQLNSLQEKISKLEQSKEHWMLEYQLLLMKHEKVLKKTQEENSTNTPTLESSSLKLKDNCVLPKSSSISSLLGNLEIDNWTAEGVGMDGIEALRQYFVSRINDLIIQRQLADSKSVTFHSEICAAMKRLSLAEKSKRELQEELSEANNVIASLKEECQTTTNSYKVQLSTMSEHLANMNDKLTSQKDEIDELKFAMNNLGNKKAKSK